jgi:hypothetical protein
MSEKKNNVMVSEANHLTYPALIVSAILPCISKPWDFVGGNVAYGEMLPPVSMTMVFSL